MDAELEAELDRAIATLQGQWIASTEPTLHWRTEPVHSDTLAIVQLVSDGATPLSVDRRPIDFRANDANLIVTLRRASFPMISILYEARRIIRESLPRPYSFELAVSLARNINQEDS